MMDAYVKNQSTSLSSAALTRPQPPRPEEQEQRRPTMKRRPASASSVGRRSSPLLEVPPMARGRDVHHRSKLKERGFKEGDQMLDQDAGRGEEDFMVVDFHQMKVDSRTRDERPTARTMISEFDRPAERSKVSESEVEAIVRGQSIASAVSQPSAVVYGSDDDEIKAGSDDGDNGEVRELGAQDEDAGGLDSAANLYEDEFDAEEEDQEFQEKGKDIQIDSPPDSAAQRGRSPGGRSQVSFDDHEERDKLSPQVTLKKMDSFLGVRSDDDYKDYLDEDVPDDEDEEGDSYNLK
jgi:hypothetical protein